MLRRCRTTATNFSIAYSMSSSVVNRPSPKRIDADGTGSLCMMALSTWRGSPTPTCTPNRRHGDVADADEQRLAVDPVEADVQVVREPVLERAVHGHAVEAVAGARRADDRATAPTRRASAGISSRQMAQARPRPTMPGTFIVPGTQTVLVAAAA